ncbi:uncharacterized protein LOC125211892 [Salvia hispanica]|uniref:uncharacterized protein LOC125211892 n=1 Tax=Salvia hispanica TaxID=49212 RepID=UPI002009CC03|nr:uncharacterized protein LOC125211892 [Salvia hispanica]
MARRSSRIHEVGEKSGLSCVGGLFSILESCQGRPGHMVISNGKSASRNIVDYPRPPDTIASFDEECRKIHHNGAGQRSDSVRVDCKGRSARSCIGDEMPVGQHRNERNMVKRQQYGKTGCELVDHRLAKTQKKTRKSSQDVYQSSSSCCLNNAARLMNELPSTSTERDSTLGAVCAENHQKEIQHSEYLQRNSFLEKYDKVDNISLKQVQMRAKAFVDQMYIDRRIVLGERRNSESKSFSNALEVLSSKRNLYMEFIPDPNSMLARPSKNMAEKDTTKSVLSEDSTSAKSRSTLVMDEAAIMNNNILQRINYELACSSKANFTAQPSDKIVILRPVPRNGKHLENRTCSYSSLQFPYKSNIRVSEEKTASFSFRDIKKKLKLSFGVTKKETRNCFNSSTNAKEMKVLKNQVLKSSRGSDLACVADTTRRKLYVSSDRSSNKPESDVILEAKRHLSTRLNSLNSVEGVTSRKSPITLDRILSSPEHDSWPFSPRRDSLYCPGSAEMRFSPYNTSPSVIESSCHVQNELSPNTVDATAFSVTPTTEAASRDKNIPTAGKMKTDGESTKPSETIDTVKAQKCDGIAMHLSSLAENEAVTSTLDNFPSTSSNSGHLIDSAENIKFQEEHQSPVSVLEPFFAEDANSPPTISLQTGRKALQPHRLIFEECSFESSPQHTPASAHPCMEEQLCQYVQLVMDASSLDWDHLSEIRSQPEQLLIHESLFDEVELPLLGCYYDPKLLFDRINQVVLEMYKCHLCSPVSGPFKARSVALAEAVLDEILAEADYFLLPTSERRSLDEIVSEGAKCAPWLDDVRLDTERIVVEISEAILEESLLELHAS